MKKIYLLIYFFILIFPYLINGQCFDCAKNLGGHNGDVATGLKKSTDGVYLLKNSGNFNLYAGLDKYDFNCNLIWSKYFNTDLVYINDLTSDSLGNIYVLYSLAFSTNAGYGPFIVDGISMNSGLNLYKFNPNGDLLWHRSLGYGNIYNNLNKIYFKNDILYVVSSHYGVLNVDNQYFFNYPYSIHSRPYICKIDLQSNILDVKSFGNGIDDFNASEMDSNGNIYLASYTYFYGTHSDLYKINSDLSLIWTKQLTNGSAYIVTKLFYNNYNDRLYTWGAFNDTVNVLGNIFIGTGINSSIFQSLLGEFNIANGDAVRIIRVDNNSSLSLPGVYGSSSGNNAYFTSRGNELYVFTSFRDTLIFPNATITSILYDTSTNSHTEELVLFKVDLSNFSTNFMMKSYGVPNLNTFIVDAAGPMLFNNDDLYLSASFESKPILFNGSTINNNSGNNASDVMFYKYNLLTNSNIGEINITNTCLNGLTNFNLNGSFDTINWNFGDPSSANNSSSIQNPSHQFSSTGSYHITATVTCGSQTQIIEKDINITPVPTINPISSFVECEDIPDTGISSNFDTSNINNLLIGNQQNVTLSFTNSNGLSLPSPLPNPYTNTNSLGDLITARAFYSNNPYCYVETTISFNTIQKPFKPLAISSQTFCVQQNAILNSIAITGQNIKWYDAQTGGNLLSNSTNLVDGTTYYASQTINSCESLRVPVLINIQNTPTPTGNASQSFCSTQNATLSDIVVSGSNIIWYNSATSTTPLPSSTVLANGVTYYATQTINNCESVNRLVVTVNLTNTLNATNYSETLCDDLNDGVETVSLSNYNTNLISNTSGCTFEYYSTLNGATNQISNDQINSNYNLNLGLNTIYVRITSINTCFQVVQLNLTLVSKPIIPIADIVPLCDKSNVTLNAGTNTNTYLWSTGATSSSITISQTGNYSVTATHNYGLINCSSTKNFVVVLSNSATISQIETVDWTENQNTITVYLNSSSIGDYEYSIDGIHYQDSNVFTNLYGGIYNVYVRDKNGCGIISDEVFLLNYPKFFTPNEDGFNDTWSVNFSYYEKGITTEIYDRFGKIIKVLNYRESWDGKYNGNMLPSDDYWFVVNRTNGKVYKGHFAMKR